MCYIILQQIIQEAIIGYHTDFCECRQVQVMNNKESGNNEGGHTPEECPDGINIQELCNGTTASPCDCQSFQECQVCKNKEGLANTTILSATCANTTPHSVHLPMLVMGHCVCWTVMEMATQTDL